MENTVAILTGVLVGILVVSLIVFGVCVAIYVLGALGAYRLAKRRGMQNAWLSWLPVGQEYILGKMSDDVSAEEPPYQKKGWWIAYPIISGAYLLLFLVNHIWSIAAMPGYMENMQWAMISGAEEDILNAVFSIFSGSGTTIMILSELMSLLSIAAAIIGSILLYRVYKRYMPNAAMAFAICGGIFGLHWLFLFIVRNRQPMYPYYPQNGYGAPVYTEVPPQNPYQNRQPNPYDWQNPYARQNPYNNSNQPPQNGG